MRDYKNTYKNNSIVRFIVLGLFIGFGLFYAITTILGILEHYGLLKNTWTITNFSWFNVVLAFIISFCFIYFPIMSIIARIKNYKRISKMSDKVAEEYKQNLEINEEVTNTKEYKEINTGNKPKSTLSEEEIKKMNHKAPIFAKRDKRFYIFLHFVGIAILEVAGIGMLINPEGNNMYGWICVIAGGIYLFAYVIPYFLTEFKGKEVYGKLLSIERRTLRHGYREFVLVAYNGKVLNLSLPFDSVDYNQWDYNDGMALLKKNVGKEIPLRVLGKNVIIDWKKMYWGSK